MSQLRQTTPTSQPYATYPVFFLNAYQFGFLTYHRAIRQNGQEEGEQVRPIPSQYLRHSLPFDMISMTAMDTIYSRNPAKSTNETDAHCGTRRTGTGSHVTLNTDLVLIDL